MRGTRTRRGERKARESGAYAVRALLSAPCWTRRHS